MSFTAHIRRSRLTLLAAGFALAFGNSAALAQRAETLPTGTVVKVKLDQDLSSRTSRVGDRFTATVIEGQDDAGLPFGTKFEGVIREATRHANGKPGMLDVEFTRMIFPNRESRNLSASLISLTDKSVSRDSNGRLVSKGSGDSERWKWVGIGAGAGLLLSTLTKSDSILTTILGAGLGYLYNETQNKKPTDVTLRAGTEFGVRLDRSFAFNPDNDRANRRTSRIDPNTNRPYDDRYLDDQYRPDTRRTSRIDPNTNRPYDDRYLDDQNRRDTSLPNDDRYYYRSDRSDRAYANGDIRVFVDEREVRFNAADRPFMRNQTVMVPFAITARAAGISYRYDASTKTISVRNGEVRMMTDTRIAFVNDRRHRLAARSEIRNGVLYVPMDFVALAIDGEAVWEANTRSLDIRSRTIER